MVHPLLNQFAISSIKKENHFVSLHLISTWTNGGNDPLDAAKFYQEPPADRGTSLQYGDDQIVANIVTNNAWEIVEFFGQALEWAKRMSAKS